MRSFNTSLSSHHTTLLSLSLPPSLLPGTSSAAIAISGMLQLTDPTTIKTLKECLAGLEPGASAVAKAVTAVSGKHELHKCLRMALLEHGTTAAAAAWKAHAWWLHGSAHAWRLATHHEEAPAAPTLASYLAPVPHTTGRPSRCRCARARN